MSVLFQKQRHLRLRADREREKAVQVTRFLEDMLSSSDPARARGQDITVRQVLDEAAARIPASLGGQPELRTAIQHTIGSTYLSIGATDSAEVHLKAALGSAASLGTEGHEDVFAMLGELSEAYARLGRYDEGDFTLARGGALARGAAWFGNIQRVG
jgi:hypothetical protein